MYFTNIIQYYYRTLKKTDKQKIQPESHYLGRIPNNIWYFVTQIFFKLKYSCFIVLY